MVVRHRKRTARLGYRRFVHKGGMAYNADCFEVMSTLRDGSVDLLFADLPYGTTSCKWDAIIPFEKLWPEFNRICKPDAVMVFTGSQPFTSALVMSNVRHFKESIVWDKKMPTGHLNAKKKTMSRHEDVLVFSRAKFGKFTYNPQMRKGRMRNKTPARKSDAYTDRTYNTLKHKGDTFNDVYYPTTILEVSNAAQSGKIHPTQKPVELLEYIIKTYSNEGEVVFDPTAGSLTTAVAAIQTNRAWVCCENDPTYFNRGVERLITI